MSILLGFDEIGEPVHVSIQQLAHQTDVMGRTGMGKTGLLCGMSIQFQQLPGGLGQCVIDPIGGLVDEIRMRIPDHRVDDVIVVDAKDWKFPFALNPLYPLPEPRELDTRVSMLMGVFELMGREGEWNPNNRQALRAILTMLFSRTMDSGSATPWKPGIDEIPAILTLETDDDSTKPLWKQDNTTYRSLLYSALENAGHLPALNYWQRLYDRILTLRPKADIAASLGGNVDQLLSNRIVRHIVGQTETRLDLRSVMDEGKILLVDVSGIGFDNAKFLAGVVMAQLHAAAFRRERGARPFFILADEYTMYATEAFREIAARARNFGVHLVTAHQHKLFANSFQHELTASGANRIFFQLVPDDAYRENREFDATPVARESEFQAMYKPSKFGSERWLEIVDPRVKFERFVRALDAWACDGSSAWKASKLNREDLKAYRDWLFAFGDPGFPRYDDEGEEWQVDYVDLIAETGNGDKSQELESWYSGTFGHINLLELNVITEGLGGGYSPEQISDWLDRNRPDAAVVEFFKNEVEKLRARETRLMDEAHSYTQLLDEDYYKERVRFPLNLNPWEQHLYNNGYGREYIRVRGSVLYERRPSQARPHSDVLNELANELTHLGQRWAKCKIVQTAHYAGREATIFTADMPALNPDWTSNWEKVIGKTHDLYCRPVAEVEADVRWRDSTMIEAVETWHKARREATELSPANGQKQRRVYDSSDA